MSEQQTGVCPPREQGRCQRRVVPPALWDGISNRYSPTTGWAKQGPGLSFVSPAFALAAVRSISCRLQVSFLPVFHPLQTQLETSSLAPLPSTPRET